MKPVIGNIVHYKTMAGEVRPAIVVNVMPSGKLNLQVFLDETGVRWVSSVPFAQDVDSLTHYSFSDPPGMFSIGTWCWPPKES